MKPFAVLLCLTTALLTLGCGSNNPTAVTKQFIAAVKKGDMEAVAKCSTKETMEAMAMFGQKLSGMLAASGDIESVKEKIDGDEAVVTVKFQKEDDPQSFNLIKVDGKWKIHEEPSSSSK